MIPRSWTVPGDPSFGPVGAWKALELAEFIVSNQQLIAILLRSGEGEDGSSFVTSSESALQLSVKRHPSGHVIKAHTHTVRDRTLSQTQEVLVLRSGSLRVDFYDEKSSYLESRVLTGGDVVLLASGGHGFEVLEDVDMIEVKLGPYQGDSEKVLISDEVARRVPLHDPFDRA